MSVVPRFLNWHHNTVCHEDRKAERVSGDSLIPITDEQAKLGQEAFKFGQEGIEALRGLGSFLDRALGSTPEALVAFLGGDWLLSSVQRFSVIVGFENSLVGVPANHSAGARPG